MGSYFNILHSAGIAGSTWTELAKRSQVIAHVKMTSKFNIRTAIPTQEEEESLGGMMIG